MKVINWKTLQKRCYVPYSGRADVCIAEGRSGKWYPGVRIENISFPLSIDAIQSALFSCLSEEDLPKNLLLPANALTDATDDSSEDENLISVDKSFPCFDQWVHELGIDEKNAVKTDHLPENHFFSTDENEISIHRLSTLTRRCLIPNSNFPVSALLKTDKGVFSGINIEVNDWHKGLCAERTALAKARSCGAGVFYEMHLFAPESEYLTPCGACRQVLAEFMPEGQVVIHMNHNERVRYLVMDLLPYQFIASGLKKQP